MTARCGAWTNCRRTLKVTREIDQDRGVAEALAVVIGDHIVEAKVRGDREDPQDGFSHVPCDYHVRRPRPMGASVRLNLDHSHVMGRVLCVIWIMHNHR